MKTKLYVQPRTGFCSRILVLNEAYQVAKECKAELIIIWKQTEDCNCEYLDTFDKEQFSDIPCKVYQTFEAKDFMVRQKEAMKIGDFKEFFRNIGLLKNWVYGVYLGRKYRKKKEVFFPYDRRNRELQAADYHKIKACLQTGKTCYTMPYEGLSGYTAPGFYELSAIRFAKKAVLEAEEVLQHHKNCIGVHIRRTDHVVAIASSQTEDFIRKMEEEIAKDGDALFFLATDDLREEEKIKEIFGDRVLVQKNKDLRRSTKTGMYTSLIDCICLSKTKYILGSERSIFSKVSAEVSKIPLYIVRGKTVEK